MIPGYYLSQVLLLVFVADHAIVAKVPLYPETMSVSDTTGGMQHTASDH